MGYNLWSCSHNYCKNPGGLQSPGFQAPGLVTVTWRKVSIIPRASTNPLHYRSAAVAPPVTLAANIPAHTDLTSLHIDTYSQFCNFYHQTSVNSDFNSEYISMTVLSLARFRIRPGWPPQPLSGTLDDQLPSMSGAHGLKDFLFSVHLLESFEWRIYSYGSVLKSKFVPQRTQEDGHYRKNPSNHELLTLRGIDRRAFQTRVGGVIPPYCPVSTASRTGQAGDKWQSHQSEYFNNWSHYLSAAAAAAPRTLCNKDFIPRHPELHCSPQKLSQKCHIKVTSRLVSEL